MITIPIEVAVPLTDLADVLTTCVEGGSTYWLDPGLDAKDISCSWGEDNTTASLRFDIDYDGKGWKTHIVTPKDLERGLRLALNDPTKLGAPLRAALSALVCSGDLGAADVDEADVILQLTCFGEVVYG